MLNDRTFAELVALFDGRPPAAALEQAARVIILLADAAGDAAVAKVLDEVGGAGGKPEPMLAGASWHGYYRSSADYRVRIALNLKGVELERSYVQLREGRQHEAAYHAINPAGLVPVLVAGAGTLAQSLAIIELLDEVLPFPELLPTDPWQRAQARALAHDIAADTHPIANLRVQRRLREQFGADDAQVREWLWHWMALGLGTVEKRLAALPDAGELVFGNQPTVAEICLVPQLYNARRFELDLTPYPRALALEEACLALQAFAEAVPERQPDCDL